MPNVTLSNTPGQAPTLIIPKVASAWMYSLPYQALAVVFMFIGLTVPVLLVFKFEPDWSVLWVVPVILISALVCGGIGIVLWINSRIATHTEISLDGSNLLISHGGRTYPVAITDILGYQVVPISTLRQFYHVCLCLKPISMLQLIAIVDDLRDAEQIVSTIQMWLTQSKVPTNASVAT